MTVNATNTSASPGPIHPTSHTPIDDLNLDSAIGVILAGLTGLPENLVIPRDQPENPTVPDVDVNWISVGVMVSTPDDSPSQVRDPSGDGGTLMHAYWTLDVLASFYGPKGNALARLVRDTMWIGQNRDALKALGLNTVDFGTVRKVPEIVAAGTRRRSDLPFRLTQAIERRYEILNILQVRGNIRTVEGTAEGGIDANQPFISPLPTGSTGGGA